MAQRVNQDNFEEKVLQSDKPVLLDFYSDSCIPCKRMAGLLGQIEDEYEDRIHVYKVNVNFEEQLTQRYGVMSAPTLVYLDKGEELGRLNGVVGRDAIEELLESGL